MKQIIIAEDEDQTRRSLAVVLESAGFKVKEAKNGIEAIEKLLSADPSSPIDLLLTDIFMPMMTGLELINIVRRRSLGLPIVVITGYRDKKLSDQLSKLDCSHLIDKPFEPDVLLECVTKIFNNNTEPAALAS